MALGTEWCARAVGALGAFALCAALCAALRAALRAEVREEGDVAAEGDAEGEGEGESALDGEGEPRRTPSS